MPYIVKNDLGILLNNNIFFGPNTFNFGVQSDLASASTVQTYIKDYNFYSFGSMVSDNFYINRGIVLGVRTIFTSAVTNTTLDLSDHIVVGSYSTGATGSVIWLGTSSRVVGKEFIIKRADVSGVTVQIRSSQVDIDDANPVSGSVNSLDLINGQSYRIVRIYNSLGNEFWTVMNYDQ
jgi:hypothetical protein